MLTPGGSGRLCGVRLLRSPLEIHFASAAAAIGSAADPLGAAILVHLLPAWGLGALLF